jgi:hypothetical protein
VPEVSSRDGGIEGPYLPQEAQVEVPEVREGADAEAEVSCQL